MDSIGDTSTLADPSVVEDLIANRPAWWNYQQVFTV